MISDAPVTILDVHIVAMSPQAFTLAGIERFDGAQYAQSWLVTTTLSVATKATYATKASRDDLAEHHSIVDQANIHVLGIRRVPYRVRL